MTNVELLQAAIESETNYNNWITSQFATIINAISELTKSIEDVKSLIAPTEPQPQTMNIPAAAKYINVAEVTLRGYLRDRIIPYSQLTKGGTITIQKTDLDNYLSSTRKKTQKEIEQIAVELLNK